MSYHKATGWLLLCDITGYTAFLTGSELEHAHEILADLMRGLIGSARTPLRTVKTEGDALFSYAPADDVADGRVVIDRIEDAYHAFRMQLFNIARSSTCTCAACANAGNLDLKFMLHFGEFVVHDLTGHDDLQGSDVILVHRLLKNDVRERLGRPAYLLCTDAARERIPGLSWIDHVETYEHLGAVPCGVRCMHAAFAELEASGAADVSPEAADASTSFEVPAPPRVAWEWHVDEDKAPKWQSGLSGWRIAQNAEGRLRPGATVHCVHGADTKSRKVLSWRPYSSFTAEAPTFRSFPPHRFTMTFEPLEGGKRTRVRWLFKMADRSLKSRFFAWLLRLMIGRVARKNAAKLAEVLTGGPPLVTGAVQPAP